MPKAEAQGAFTAWSPEDLRDPHLFRVNQTLNFLAQQIAALQGAAGNISLRGDVGGIRFSAEDLSVPTEPGALLTLSAATKLFGDSNQLTATALKKNPVPFPSGGGGGGGIGATRLQEVALSSAGPTLVTPIIPATERSFLIVVLTCDATPGNQVTWDPAFKDVDPDDLQNAAHQLNFYLFVGRADLNWWKLSTNLGVSP